MKWWLALLMLGLWLSMDERVRSDAQHRCALVEASWDQTEFSQAVLQSLRDTLSTLPTVHVMEPTMVKAAVKGFRYDGSLNLTIDQARDLGAAIGCESFILGRAGLAPQIQTAGQLVHRAWLGLFLVNARSGQLVCFAFLEDIRSTPAEAAAVLFDQLQSKLPEMINRVTEPLSASKSSEVDAIEVNNPDAPPPSVSFMPPHIISSRKPTYTKQAQMAEVTATVDLKVVFQPDGTIGPIEVVRWAGFGLDESATEAARTITFRPAQNDGHAVAARALVQYKFSLKSEAETPIPASPHLLRPPASE